MIMIIYNKCYKERRYFMSVQMLEISHIKASVDVRSVFSFTKKQAVSSMIEINKKTGVKGVVIISTCNRMELWASIEDDKSVSLFDLLEEIKQIDISLYKQYFVQRFESEAAIHLFRLACGLESQILGEDQIITQVKEALSLSRENFCTDNVLETLFRMAITAAKKVKTKVYFNRANYSVIHKVIETLQEKGYNIKQKNVMVIGNGQMGKLASLALKEAGANVTVTIRQYKSGIVEIPKDCNRIDYGKRMEHFKFCDLVVSATSSPNYTLKQQDISKINLSHKMILIDLAVPRDIEPEIANINNIELYDLDSFKVDIQSEQTKKSILEADEILKQQLEEFLAWYQCRDIIPKIQHIKENTITDLETHMQKLTKNISIEEKEILNSAVEYAAEKVINKMLFGLRDIVNQDVFRTCIEALEKLYK